MSHGMREPSRDRVCSNPTLGFMVMKKPTRGSSETVEPSVKVNCLPPLADGAQHAVHLTRRQQAQPYAQVQRHSLTNMPCLDVIPARPTMLHTLLLHSKA